MLALMINKKLRMKFLSENFNKWRFLAKMMNEKMKKVKDKLERLGQIYNMKNLSL
jgi:hypothetical protein